MTRKRYQPVIEGKQILDEHLCFYELFFVQNQECLIEF